MAKADLTVARLRELMSYAPETGVFNWAVQRQGPGATKGRAAGCVAANGYIVIGADRGRYTAHRLAWLCMTGAMPVGAIDGNKQNNAWANLRLASRSENAQNIRKPHSDGASGFLGVSLSTRNKKNPWVAQITEPGHKRKNLGYFSTAEKAHAAYVAAKRLLHPGCTI